MRMSGGAGEGRATTGGEAVIVKSAKQKENQYDFV